MSQNHYMVNLLNFINNHGGVKKAVVFLDVYMPKVIVFSFYAALAILALQLDIRVIFVGAIPWITFLFVTIIRNRLNFKRPFEELPIEPLTSHSTGKACPSRHASSSVVIAMAIYYVFPLWGIFVGIISVIICITRVLTGVHYPRDVMWGAAVGVICGYIGFFCILK